jgi:tetratricopeptide (TPR) repeat protein
MISSVEEFFKSKTDNLSFMHLKEEASVNIRGYKISSDIPMPMLIDELVEEIKTNRAQEEIKITSFIDGMIYVIGVDPGFKYADEYKKILYKYNENIEDYILYKGIKFMDDNKIDDSLAFMKALVTLNNSNIKGIFNYACALEEKANRLFKYNQNKLAKKFLGEAVSQLEDITNIEPNFSLAYYKLGYHYMHMKQFKKCQITWEKFLDLDDNEDRIEEIEVNLAKIQDDVTYEEGYYEILRGKAEVGLEKLLPLKEKYSDWWNLLFIIGLGYRQLGRFVEAKKEFENVLAIKPNQPDTLNELGLCLASLGEYEEAVNRFTQAINLRPNDYEIKCNRGMTYLKLGKLDEAAKDIEAAYKQNPNDEITILCKQELDKMRNMG